MFMKRLHLLPALAATLGLTFMDWATAQTYTNLYSLKGGSDGATPRAGLILSGDTLFGTTSAGGSSAAGTVFKVNPDGTGFTTLYTFTNRSDGAGPSGLTLSGSTLYGAAGGGRLRWGTVFAIKTDGTGFTNLYNFTNGNDGSGPNGGLMVSGNTLYGTAAAGGSLVFGTVFQVNTDGTGFKTLHHFAGFPSDGRSPNGALIRSGNRLYGTASSGGKNNNGTAFGINIDGTAFTNLYHFTGKASNGQGYFTNRDGATPLAGLTLSGDTLYGTAEFGGSVAGGTLFSVNTDGTGFTTLVTFTSVFGTYPNYVNTGYYPNGDLVLSSNVLYGTAQGGGYGQAGTIFSVHTDGTGFLVLHTFPALAGADSTNSDGAYPTAGLLVSGNSLYGTASAGGCLGHGSIFNFSRVVVPLGLLTTSLPPATIAYVGPPYGVVGTPLLFASGGQLPYVWTINGGTLPPGIDLQLDGILNGIPTTIGTFNFTVQVTDAVGTTATRALSLQVVNPDTLTLRITNVPAGLVVSNVSPQFIVGGTAVESGPAAGNVRVANVFCSVNNSAVNGVGTTDNWTTWSALVRLSPGLNTIVAYAIDTAGTVSATHTVTINFVVPPSALVADVPGTPLSTNWNSGGDSIQIFEGGGMGVQPLFMGFPPNSIAFTALPGDVVFLLNPNGGNHHTNWAAVVNFFNPSDPNGTQGLPATGYQTFFPANPGPNYFANFPAFPQVAYVPIATTVTNVGAIAYYDEIGPVGGIRSGQFAAFTIAAAIQTGPVSVAPQLTIIRFGTKVVLTWPTNAAGFTLQSTSNLVSPVLWTAVAGQNTVTNPISGTQKFYRLSP